MKTIKDILKKFDPLHDKYISREYQSFGVYLAEKLGEERRKSLYIKLARDIPRPVLEEALRFVIDARAKRKAALFMWKLKKMGAFTRKKRRKTKPINNIPRPNGQKKKFL